MRLVRFFGLGIAVLASLSAAVAGTSTYNLDTVHSTVIFRIQHIGISYSYGRFNDISGTAAYDPASPDSTSFNLTVKAASVDTGNERRDNHLRGPDFFNAAQFPLITFRSTKVEAIDDDTLKVTGDLSLHGITRPVTTEIQITGYGERPAPFGTRVGFEAQFTIKRSEFGMTYGIDNGGVGDEDTLIVAIEALRQ